MRVLAVGALSTDDVVSEMRGEIRKMSGGIAPFRLGEGSKHGRASRVAGAVTR